MFGFLLQCGREREEVWVADLSLRGWWRACQGTPLTPRFIRRLEGGDGEASQIVVGGMGGREGSVWRKSDRKRKLRVRCGGGSTVRSNVCYLLLLQYGCHAGLWMRKQYIVGVVMVGII